MRQVLSDNLSLKRLLYLDEPLFQLQGADLGTPASLVGVESRCSKEHDSEKALSKTVLPSEWSRLSCRTNQDPAPGEHRANGSVKR